MESTDQILVNRDAITELVNCVGLPEWNLYGEMSDWIQIVAEAVENLGVEIPKSGICPNCDQWRLDRTSEDGTWEVTFATHCPHCGEGTEEDDVK